MDFPRMSVTPRGDFVEGLIVSREDAAFIPEAQPHQAHDQTIPTTTCGAWGTSNWIRNHDIYT